MSKSTCVITATNHKGGCGKTSTIVNLASELARLKKSVLVIDLDPQGNASSHISPVTPSSLNCTITDLLMDGGPEKLVASILEETRIPGVSLIPATQKLLALSEENKLRDLHKHHYEVLSRIIAPLDGIFDYILIDTPPSLGVLTANALIASTHFIVPIHSGSPYSIEGLAGLLPFIQNIQKANPSLKALGLLLTNYNERQRADRITQATLTQIYKDTLPVIPIEIISSTSIDFAALQKLSLSQLDENSPITHCFVKLAHWINKNT